MKIVYTVFSSEDEATRLIADLLEQRLIACANLFPKIHSFYRWEGVIASDQEYPALLKTKDECVSSLITYLNKAHSYECPCVIVLPVENGNPAFIEWVNQQCL